MNFYQKSLHWISLFLMAVSLLDAIIELTIYHMFRAPSMELLPLLQTPLGICLKDGLGLLAGLLVWLRYRDRHGMTWLFRVELLLLAAVLLVILLAMPGRFFSRIEGLLDLIVVLMLFQLYTMLQLQRGERQWQRVSKTQPATLDLKLRDSQQWFNPLEIGPRLALSEEVFSLVDRFLSTARAPQPLEITIQSAEPISDPLRNIMREVFAMHYEDEERRVNGYLESRYRRVLMLVIVSLTATTLWTKVFPTSSGATYAILGNFAGFSLWQIGTTYFERSEGYKSLLRMMIAREAKISFLDKA